MSVKIIFIEDLFCPVFVCDVCGESIKRAGRAAAVYRLDYKAARTDVQHVHKGRCLDIAEERIGKGFGWAELHEHIDHLAENCGHKKRPT